ncbi:YsnF/AvaK domain-containing protein [Planomicrobium okeanokoites]|uniref:YsnF/AvaK domain-containing protein n=1 Tax=Planomicrobium okeanokoites TaxID=244 RepID=UPI00249154B9|nr:YsnF/AvaK domain-containing protein [Planomicrobium okeanokoites]
MTNNKFMGTFDTESEVLQKIEELKATGSREEDMYVMARDKDQISMVRGRTDVDYKSSEGNWMDKFMGFLSGDDSTREAFSGMGLDKDESDRYYNEVQNGKILLFVDREFGANYEGKAPYDNQAYGRTGTGTESDITDSRSPGYVESGTVARDGLTVDTNDENDVYYNSKRENALGEGESMDRSIRDDETAGVGHDSGTGFGLGSPTTGTNYSDADSDRDRDYDRDRLDNDSTLGRDHTDEEKLRLHEERLHVDKEQVKTGEVNVGKHVVEEERSVDVPVEREEVYVERRPVDENSTDAHDKGFNDNENINIPVSEERVNVSKNDVVSEEIVVGKRKVEDTETVRDTVRREEADIDEDVNLTDEERRRDRDNRDRF